MGKYMSVTYNAQAVTDPIHPKRPACRKPALELLLNPRAPAPWQHSHQELDKSYGLPETSTSAVPIPALPALLQDWPKSPSPRNNNTHTWFHQGKNGPATSQDLFKTEEKAFFTDIMKYIGMEKDTEGVLSEVQRLWSCYFHHDATGELSRKEEGKGALLSSAWDLAWEAEHTLPVPSVDEEWRQCICSPCIQKAQNRCEIALVSLQRTGYHLASSYVAFLLLKTCQKIICQ